MTEKPSELCLLPCPFCGAEAKITVIRDGRRVHCRACLASGPPAFNGPENIGPAHIRAAAAWNTRHLLQEPQTKCR